MRRMYSEKQLDTQIKEVIESGQVDNAKPIYWHGLDIYTSGSNSIQAHVLNNNNAHIDSINKLYNWIESTGATNVKLACNGVVSISGAYKTCYFIKFNMSSGTITTIQIYYFDETNGYGNVGSLSKETFANTYFAKCEDSVNKIN